MLGSNSHSSSLSSLSSRAQEPEAAMGGGDAGHGQQASEQAGFGEFHIGAEPPAGSGVKAQTPLTPSRVAGWVPHDAPQSTRIRRRVIGVGSALLVRQPAVACVGHSCTWHPTAKRRHRDGSPTVMSWSSPKDCCAPRGGKPGFGCSSRVESKRGGGGAAERSRMEVCPPGTVTLGTPFVCDSRLLLASDPSYV